MIPNNVEVAVLWALWELWTRHHHAPLIDFEAFTFTAAAAEYETTPTAGVRDAICISSDGLEPLRAWVQRHRAHHHPDAAVADHAVGHPRVVERHQPTGDDGNPTLAAPAAAAAAAAAAARAHQHLTAPFQVHADGEAQDRIAAREGVGMRHPVVLRDEQRELRGIIRPEDVNCARYSSGMHAWQQA